MVKSDSTQVGPTVTGYLCYWRTFSVVAAPLSRLCSPAIPFLYGVRHVNVLFEVPSFVVLKLLSAVKLEVDATVSGAGAVLFQAGKSGVSYPVCYLLSLNATSSTT